MGSIPPRTPQFLVIGAGSRGHAYARAVQVATPGRIVAIAEIDPYKRADFGRRYIWGDNSPLPGQEFDDWKRFVEFQSARHAGAALGHSDSPDLRVDGVFICTLDSTHADIIRAIAPLDLHIMCEKPLTLTMNDCLSMSQALSQYPLKIVSIGHVLRYSPHNMTLRDLLVNKQVIGEIVSIEHTEPVGWWHFSHSYVRGNWRRAGIDGTGSLLTKSCHDIDFLLWLLCSPSPLTGTTPHEPSTITSSGALTQLKRAKKPAQAGGATNCLNCAAEPVCMYSARKIYLERKMKKEKDLGWPVKIVVPDIEEIVQNQGWDAGERKLMEKLGEDYDRMLLSDDAIAARAWYGRCVYESDNDVCDDQTVTMTWNDEGVRGRGSKQALFHMTAPTVAQCERRGRVYGSLGEIEYDSRTITVSTFADGQVRKIDIPKQDPEAEKSHGGGDWGLAGAFVKAVQASDAGELSSRDAQMSFVGCDLDEIVRSHAVVFAAEEARLRRTVIDWKEWWQRSASISKPMV